ncbi:MAG: GlsB/YeaQ/YmgE family stress response membrane protein [Myxococcaceae bacterium]
MNPAYGIIMWIVIGALAGWIGSKIMGTDAAQGGIANILIGVVGAVVGGFVTRTFFGDSTSNNGFFASFLVALLGAVVLIGIWKAVAGRRRLA